MASEQPLEFYPDALAELERAKAWYDGQRPGLGESFSQEITTAISRIILPTLNWSSRHGRDAFETKTGLLAGTIKISAQLPA